MLRQLKTNPSKGFYNMPFLTTYEIQTTGAPVAAYDYTWTPDGLDVLPLNENGIMPNAYSLTIPYDQFKGIKSSETRLPALTGADRPDEEPAQIESQPDPAPITENMSAISDALRAISQQFKG